MRLLKRLPNDDVELTSFSDDNLPPYAILSHTWGTESEEVTSDDIEKRVGQQKAGFEKIRFCAERAAQDGLEYFWVDSCCIKKEIAVELQHAISSMFRWYQRSIKCYVYLSDIPDKTGVKREQAFQRSKWFTRGWTLQELLAPVSVEFFSADHCLIGDKHSLEQHIHEITRIPKAALRGESLYRFSDTERFRWMHSRETKYEEDLAYSLLGIFGVDLDLRYGEGKITAFERLQREVEKVKTCCQDIRLIDPEYHKQDVEFRRGGLLEDAYRWILEHPDFQIWRNDERSSLLWIKGDPGKGKTMLLCGIINELKKSIANTALLSFFFCVATDSRSNNAAVVLRGLIYTLICQQPSLFLHIRKRYDYAGKALFEDWFALSDIFTEILKDENLNTIYLIVDALDECVAEDLPKLLGFIVTQSSITSRIKWIVSSRNWPSIEKELNATQKVRLCLELNEDSISTAVATYIHFKVDWLAKQNRYSNDTKLAIQRHLSLNAKGTFLWVALVCQELTKVPGWKVPQKLAAFPPGLDALYMRMIEQIRNSEDKELCTSLLAITSTVYRPVTLDELAAISDVPDGVFNDDEALSEIVGLCGSFLTLRDRTVLFVHQSAKEFLIQKAYQDIYPSRIENVHHTIFRRSLHSLSKILLRDIYGLNAHGVSIDQVKQPIPDPLSSVKYSCVYWISHLLDCDPTRDAIDDLQDGGSVDMFLRQRYLYWLEALSLCRSMSEGVISIKKLEALLQTRLSPRSLPELVKDACRFIMSYKQAIENSPLQAYVSALLFSPTDSVIRRLFQEEEPEWVTIKPSIDKQWSPCLQTLEGYSGIISSVTFSHDSTRLASGSWNCTVKIWDAGSGQCLRTLRGHSESIYSVAYSHESTQLATGSGDDTVKIWDTESGQCLQTLEGHSDAIFSVAYSHDSTQLATGSGDSTVKIWDTESSQCLQTLEGHISSISSIAFSHNSAQLASGSMDYTAKIWDTGSSQCLYTLKGHNDDINSVVFSHNSTRLASGSEDHTIKIWNTGSGICLQTLEGHSASVRSVAFSNDSTRLASGSYDCTLKIWDTRSGQCLQTLKGHSNFITTVAFSHDSTRLASGSYDHTLKIWDTGSSQYLQTLEKHSDMVCSVAFSYDSTRLASGSYDHTVKIWDTERGQCLRTLEGHSNWVTALAFSYDSTRLASGSRDYTLKIWDIESSQCLQTLNIGKTPYSISYDTRDSYLNTRDSYMDTKIGVVALDNFSASAISTDRVRDQSISYQDIGFNTNREWITHNSKKLVWLPSDYRPRCSIKIGNMIGLGTNSGRVWICNLELNESSE